MINALTIDVEDYFQVQAKPNSLKGMGWENYASRIERNTYHILELLINASRTPSSDLQISPSLLPEPNRSISNLQSAICNPITATFFCLGWIAQKFPQLIKEIQAQGHEVACHGYTHQLIFNMSREEFRKDIRKAKGILEDLTGDEVIGYRAPCFSINQKSLWALKVLAEEGFKYDSSILPIHHDLYGFPEAPRFPFRVSLNGNGSPEFGPLLSISNSERRTLDLEPGILNSELFNTQSIMEFPPSTFQLANMKYPICNGGYLHLLPYFIFKMGLKRINEREGQPFIFHLHPWELNFDQHQTNQTERKLHSGSSRLIRQKEKRSRTILEEFSFSSIKDLLAIYIPPIRTDTLQPIYFN
jgi:polysaccharide deacetylase family protein (PEP-CTERM system associated)